jgi:hypothetical protein
MAAPPLYNSDSKIAEDLSISEKALALKLFILKIIAYAYGAN